MSAQAGSQHPQPLYVAALEQLEQAGFVVGLDVAQPAAGLLTARHSVTLRWRRNGARWRSTERAARLGDALDLVGERALAWLASRDRPDVDERRHAEPDGGPAAA